MVVWGPGRAAGKHSTGVLLVLCGKTSNKNNFPFPWLKFFASEIGHWISINFKFNREHEFLNYCNFVVPMSKQSHRS